MLTVLNMLVEHLHPICEDGSLVPKHDTPQEGRTSNNCCGVLKSKLCPLKVGPTTHKRSAAAWNPRQGSSYTNAEL